MYRQFSCRYHVGLNCSFTRRKKWDSLAKLLSIFPLFISASSVLTIEQSCSPYLNLDNHKAWANCSSLFLGIWCAILPIANSLFDSELISGGWVNNEDDLREIRECNAQSKNILPIKVCKTTRRVLFLYLPQYQKKGSKRTMQNDLKWNAFVRT